MVGDRFDDSEMKGLLSPTIVLTPNRGVKSPRHSHSNSRNLRPDTISFMIRALIASALLLVLLLPGFSQTSATAGAGLSKDPREVLAAAALFYDFASPELKPWHLKAVYQFYDQKGSPTYQGVWEYWWVSPKIYRSSWSRTGVEHTTWSTADGALYRKDLGGRLRYFERTIQGTVLFQLPGGGDIDSSKVKLDLKMLPPDKPEFACVVTQRLVGGKLQAPSSGEESYYCFDPATLVLRETYSGQLRTEFNQFVKTQGRYLAQQIVVTVGQRKLFTASVDTIEALNPTDAMFSPPSDATLERKSLPGDNQGITMGSLVKKTQPGYPSISKNARDQGAVTLAALIGKDGRVHDLEVLASPSPELAASAMDAVKKWEYKPYLLNGEAVEADTIVTVIFRLGY